jgi:hypothetical protein
MSAWLLAALLCTPASAQVFETGGAAAPVAPVSGSVGAVMGAAAPLSPISAVPGASMLAPSLNAGALIKAFSRQAAPNSNMPAGAVRFVSAPLPALPAAAAASGVPAAPTAPRSDAPRQAGAASAKRESIPPSSAAGQAGSRAVAADRRRGSGADAAPEGASARLDAAGRELSAPLDADGGFDRVSAEGAAELGSRIFDRAGDRALLADGSATGSPGASAIAGAADRPSPSRDPLLAASAGGSAEGEALRDAVASPIPAAAAPGAAFSFFRLPVSLFAPSRGSSAAAPAAGAAASAAPVTFERLSLELGSGLVVKVRAALGLAPAAATAGPFGGSVKGAPAAAFSTQRRPRVPITSTEWLERRGLLESISVSEAAASQEAASLPARAVVPGRAAASWFGASPRPAAVPALVLDPTTPVRVPPFAWWGLAFLPAGLVLLKELL